MFKSILITAILLITISLSAQEKKNESYQITLTDSTIQIMTVRLNEVLKIVDASQMPHNQVKAITQYLNETWGVIDNELKELKKAEATEEKPKSKAKSK